MARFFRNVEKAIKKGVKDTGRAVKKGAIDTGHGIGAVATSKAGLAALAGGLAFTGVGLPAAAAIGAGVKGGGSLIRKGGNPRNAFRGAYQGAAVGAGAAVGGSGFRAVRDKAGFSGFRNQLYRGKSALPDAPKIERITLDDAALGLKSSVPIELARPDDLSSIPSMTESGITRPALKPGLTEQFLTSVLPEPRKATPSDTMLNAGRNAGRGGGSDNESDDKNFAPKQAADIGGGDTTSSGMSRNMMLALAAGVIVLFVFARKH